MENNRSGNLFAFLLGVVVGGVATLLLTPVSGPEARRRLAEGVTRLRDETSKFIQEGADLAGEKVEEAKEFASTRKAAFQEAFKAGKETYLKEVKETTHVEK